MNREATLAKLLEACQDGGLSETEENELLRQLETDVELRRLFAGQVAMLGALRATSDQTQRWLALFDLLECESPDNGGNGPASFETLTMRRIAMQPSIKLPPAVRPASIHRSSPPRPAWHRLSSVRALAAAVVLLLVASFVFKSWSPAPPRQASSAPSRSDVSTVAVLAGASPGYDAPVGTCLKPGPLAMSSGWLTVQTLGGAVVTFDAPFRAELIDHKRIRLNEGTARVRIQDGSKGFRLESPTFDVVDLGTEFAAKVNADGTGSCRVFEGKADVSLLDSLGEVKHTRRLTANHSVRLNPTLDDISSITESDGDYPQIKQPRRPSLTLPSSYADDVKSMKPSGYWRFEEIIHNEVADEIADGAHLQAYGSATIAGEGGENHSGELTSMSQVGFFQIPNKKGAMLKGDFSIVLFVQFDWLQNSALISAGRYDPQVKGDSFILQSYSAYRHTGVNGTGLHAVLRDPPGWNGGFEVFGNTTLRPLHWHHIAAIRGGTELFLYLDGLPVGSETTGSMPLDSRHIFVGRLDGNAARSRAEALGLVGHIDELAVFPRALSAEEITRLSGNLK